METKKDTELYLQLWISPIKNGALSELKPEAWHTLCALASFMNKSGECYPSLKTLAKMLGLKDLGAVSARVKKLEEYSYENDPILIVKRGKKQSEKGTFVYANNIYLINPNIFSIFSTHPTTLIRREEQMKKFQEMKQKILNSLSMDTKRDEANITIAK